MISAVTKAAAESGARAGARLTDARALEPGLVAIPADPAGDAALVERLARWAARWSPLVEVDGARRAAARRQRGRASVRRRGGAGRGCAGAVRGAWADQRGWRSRRRRARRGRWRGLDADPRRNPLPRAGRDGEVRALPPLAPLPVAALRLSPQAVADARAARPQDHRRAGRGAAPGARAAVPRGRQSARRARPRAGPQARAADRDAVRAAAAQPASARGAGDPSRSRGPGARAADPRPRRRSWSGGISARGGWR